MRQLQPSPYQTGGSGKQAGKPTRSTASIVRFLVVFVVLVLAASLLIRTSWVEESVLVPYTSFITRLAGATLRAIGVEVQVQGTAILHPTFSVEIRRGCDGMEATLLLVCATLAYPFCSFRRRGLALVTGYITIFVLNLIRVVGLFLLGFKGFTQVFQFVHTYVAQFAIVTAVMILWLFWIAGDRPVKTSADGSQTQTP